MSSTQHQLIEQCATRLRGIVEALDNIHDTSPHRWSTDLDDVHSSAESLLAMINDQASNQADLAQPSPKCATCNDRGHVCLDWEAGAWEECPDCAQAEAERPEMSSERAAYFMRRFKSEEKLLGPNEQAAVDYVLSLIAQHERIVGDLQRQKHEADTALAWATRHYQTVEQERDAALAKLAELEAKLSDPTAVHQWQFSNAWFDGSEEVVLKAGKEGSPIRTLYAAPVAQAQPEETPGEILAAKLIETWVTKHGKPAPWSTAVEITAVATNMPNDERDRLLALDDDVDAQAQHSVPEGFRELLEMLVVSDLRKIRYAGAWRREVHDRASSILALLAAAPGKSVPQAWLDVQAERRRQVEAENWTPEHDDQHSDGQMAQAAGCYALHAGGIGTDWPGGIRNGSALFWPWDEEWWKPSTARRDMVKACALGLAEIERLDRVAASQGGPSDA
ncbi:TPA: hypothetical protein ACGS08_001080 [Pseudomonas aeruginosa]|uniref:hypothetical protein n=1 Tax=Pseudomonas aeruginosa TaxID=287 RepID=UPI00372997E9